MMNKKPLEEKEEGLLPVENNQLDVGLDEVGRGSIYGPVFAAVVVLTKKNAFSLRKLGIKDSKELSHRKRELFIDRILDYSSDWGIGQSSVSEIDKHGIRSATEIAMIRALDKLKFKPKNIYVDGSLPLRLWEGSQENIIRGESKFISIAASSILAKVNRDLLMQRLSEKHKEYHLSKNKGYGTKEHFSSLHKNGLTNLHRKSFLKNLNIIG